MSVIVNALRNAAGLFTYGLRIFAVVYLLSGLLCGALLSITAFSLAYDGSPLRGVLAVIVALALCATLGLLVAARLSVFLMASRAIREAAIGRLAFDALFDGVLGVTPDNPQGDTKLTRGLHGLPVKEVEARLNRAAAALLEARFVEGTIPGLALWLAARLQRVLVWATIRVIVSQCTVGGTREGSVDLLELRHRLAGRIDTLLSDWLKHRVTRFTLWVAGVAVALAVGVALGIRQLPL